MSYVDITPDTSIVLSWANQLTQWGTILGELVDNAFDANATRVGFTLERDRLRIEDDGVGCPDLGLMLRAGKNIKHPSTRLGRYGIGFKQAVASAGQFVTVVSVHQGMLRQVAVDWNRLASSGIWGAQRADPVPTAAPSGTVITISRLRSKSGLSKAQISTLVTRLSEQYTPAIKQGRQILLHAYGQSIPLQPVQPPELEHMRRLELLVGRKRATLELGLVPEGVSSGHHALTVSYGFRVIQRGVRWGLGDEPTPGLVGWLDLLDGWNLSTNKEKVLDEDLEALGKQIAERCADVIARAVQRGYSVPLDEANAALAGMLHSLQSERVRRKAVRRPPENPTGKVLPTATGRRHTTAAVVQPGKTFLHPRQTTGIKIALSRLGVDGGLFHCQDGGIIELNLDNPVIAAMRMDQGFLACIAVLGLAPSVILKPQGQQAMVFRSDVDGDILEQIAAMANRMLRYLPSLS